MAILENALLEIISEITTADAYSKFYTSIPQEDYNDIVNVNQTKNGKSMNPILKFILDSVKSNAANKISAIELYSKIIEGGQTYWNKVTNEIKNNPSISFNDLYEKVFDDEFSDTEKGYYVENGYVVLEENENEIVTACLTYEASRKYYGDTHWCTTSDLFGKYDGYMMFRHYVFSDYMYDEYPPDDYYTDYAFEEYIDLEEDAIYVLIQSRLKGDKSNCIQTQIEINTGNDFMTCDFEDNVISTFDEIFSSGHKLLYSFLNKKNVSLYRNLGKKIESLQSKEYYYERKKFNIQAPKIRKKIEEKEELINQETIKNNQKNTDTFKKEVESIYNINDFFILEKNQKSMCKSVFIQPIFDNYEIALIAKKAGNILQGTESNYLKFTEDGLSYYDSDDDDDNENYGWPENREEFKPKKIGNTYFCSNLIDESLSCLLIFNKDTHEIISKLYTYNKIPDESIINEDNVILCSSNGNTARVFIPKNLNAKNLNSNGNANLKYAFNYKNTSVFIAQSFIGNKVIFYDNNDGRIIDEQMVIQSSVDINWNYIAILFGNLQKYIITRNGEISELNENYDFEKAIYAEKINKTIYVWSYLDKNRMRYYNASFHPNTDNCLFKEWVSFEPKYIYGAREGIHIITDHRINLPFTNTRTYNFENSVKVFDLVSNEEKTIPMTKDYYIDTSILGKLIHSKRPIRFNK